MPNYRIPKDGPKQLYISGGCGQEHKVGKDGQLESCEQCEQALERGGFVPVEWRVQE